MVLSQIFETKPCTETTALYPNTPFTDDAADNVIPKCNPSLPQIQLSPMCFYVYSAFNRSAHIAPPFLFVCNFLRSLGAFVHSTENDKWQMLRVEKCTVNTGEIKRFSSVSLRQSALWKIAVGFSLGYYRSIWTPLMNQTLTAGQRGCSLQGRHWAECLMDTVHNRLHKSPK